MIFSLPRDKGISLMRHAMVDSEILHLLAENLLTMFESSNTGIVVYIDPVKRWRIADLRVVYANPTAKRTVPIESNGEWDKLPERSPTVLQAARYNAKEMYKKGVTSFGPHMQYTSSNTRLANLFLLQQ